MYVIVTEDYPAVVSQDDKTLIQDVLSLIQEDRIENLDEVEIYHVSGRSHIHWLLTSDKNHERNATMSELTVSILLAVAGAVVFSVWLFPVIGWPTLLVSGVWGFYCPIMAQWFLKPLVKSSRFVLS